MASVDCLTQLPLLPASWLLRKGESESSVENFGRALMEAHIEQLSAPGVPVCLIAELEDRRTGSRGRVLDRTDYRPWLLPPLENRQARAVAEWEWLTHPEGELRDGSSEIRTVSAWQW
jgi:hypothetical protein